MENNQKREKAEMDNASATGSNQTMAHPAQLAQDEYLKKHESEDTKTGTAHVDSAALAEKFDREAPEELRGDKPCDTKD